jgi:hypothetical protein
VTLLIYHTDSLPATTCVSLLWAGRLRVAGCPQAPGVQPSTITRKSRCAAPASFAWELTIALPRQEHFTRKSRMTCMGSGAVSDLTTLRCVGFPHSKNRRSHPNRLGHSVRSTVEGISADPVRNSGVKGTR